MHFVHYYDKIGCFIFLPTCPTSVGVEPLVDDADIRPIVCKSGKSTVPPSPSLSLDVSFTLINGLITPFSMNGRERDTGSSNPGYFYRPSLPYKSFKGLHKPTVDKYDQHPLIYTPQVGKEKFKTPFVDG